MKKGFAYLFIITLLFSSVVYAEKYSFEKLGISEIEIPATYYLLDEQNADNSYLSTVIFNEILNLKSNLPMTFINDDTASIITIEPLDKVENARPGFAMDNMKEKEFAELKSKLSEMGITTIELVDISNHKYVKANNPANESSSLGYAMNLNGRSLTFRITNLFGEISSYQEEELLNVVKSASFIIEKEKSGIEKFFASIFNFFKSYTGQVISNNLIWILLGVGGFIIWGLFALITRIFKPKRRE